MKKFLDNIATWATVISAVFLILGLLRAIFYFSPFGIPILTFIDLSEVFTTWFTQIIYVLLICSVISVLYPVLKYANISPTSYFVYYYFVVYITHIVSLGYLYFDLLRNVFGNYSEEWLHYTRFNYSILFVISMIFGFGSLSGIWDVIKVLRKKQINLEFNRVRGYTVVTLLVISGFIWSITLPIAIEMTTKDYIQVKLYGKSDTITTNDTLRYLGKTRNYIFLWDKKKRVAEIYKSDDFDRITFGTYDFKN
ncbi:hypothetical protein [Pedobacter sp. R20-19]|uniref:hypothetical protein n=1 Tax=Pedobacter sp. R20-19 TaxID=1270196 RepID=UPI00049381DA|nr:hypothetical protein [Pedobacter sp. R20-19]